MVEILTRSITEAEAQLLIENIKRTPNIIGYTLEEWLSAEYVVVAENDQGVMIGACLNYDFHTHWRKIAALIVFEEFRGQGIGSQLFRQSFHEAVQDGKNVYTLSANPLVLKMMRDLKFDNFDSFADFLAKNAKCRILFLSHTIVWLASGYRLKEIIRKYFVYQREKGFIIGIKTFDG